ncbi:MFS transporter [Suttonella ornithocola]|uniref:Phosphoglycerate transporter family protein n=1 Tax=Suttonella ornithocola TaxID=279832 RepID=A0A380MW33_9GAMM|nr:MFS transporter [Suttonella ornithocola]SUO96508.1 phosphoglycerate transporter family protein [Suttonella ornithocola]
MTTSTALSVKQGLMMFFVLLIAYIIFAANWVAGSALGPEIINYFFHGEPVSSIVSQVVNYTITIARIFANFLAAIVLIRLGVKKAAAVGVFLLMFALVAVWMPNYWLYTASRMIMALGASMVMIYMNPVVSRFVSREQKVTFSAMITMSYNVGAFIVAVLFAFWSETMNHDWQITMSILSGLSIITFLAWLLVAKDFDTTSPTDGTATEYYGYSRAMKDSFNWIFALGFSGFLFLYVMSLTTYPAVLPKYLPFLNKGWITLSVAGGGIIGTVLSIIVGSRALPRRPICALFGSLMIVMMIFAFISAKYSALAAYTFMFLSGFFMFGQYSIYLNMPHELPSMTPQRATIMFGMIWALGYFFYTIFNILWSIVLDNWGWDASMIFYFAISSLYLLALWCLPETNPS